MSNVNATYAVTRPTAKAYPATVLPYAPNVGVLGVSGPILRLAVGVTYALSLNAGSASLLRAYGYALKRLTPLTPVGGVNAVTVSFNAAYPAPGLNAVGI